MKTILFAGNFKVVHNGLRMIIEKERQDFTFVGEVATIVDLAMAMQTHKPDVLITSHQLLYTNVAAHLTDIKKHHPHTKILMLTMASGINTLLDNIENIDGLVFLDADVQTILHALDMVVKGEKYLQVP